MSNTIIQIKRSTVSNTPANGSLQAGELAYSFLSNKLFTGNSSGLGIVEIGGKYWIDTTVTAYNRANAAFDQGTAGYDRANAAFTQGSAAYDRANTAYNHANAAYSQANTALSTGQAAFNKANNALPLTGGTITGDLAVVGNLFLSGNTTLINVSTFRVSDPLIYLAGNNYVSDLVDIGFIGNYVNATGSNVHTGLFRDHGTKEYYLFQGYDKEPDNNHIDPSGNNFSVAILNADIRTSNLILNGQNVASLLQTIYNTANSNTFSTFNVSGTNLVADLTTDTLTITSGNGVILIPNAGTDSFNIALSPTGVTQSTYGGADRVGVFTVDTWGRITGASNVSIALDASAITGGILPVPRGGTGVGTFTQNGILYGNTTGSLKVTGAGSEGQVLQADSSGVPQFGMLDGGNF